MKLTFLFTLACCLPAADLTQVVSADGVIANMMSRDAERQAGSTGYTGMRRYTLENKSRHASMLVRVTGTPDGTKRFEIVEESGSGQVRKHVFHKILDEEAEASRPNVRARSRIDAENYGFHAIGTEPVEGRSAYVIEVTPKNENKYLIAGRIWVDAEDFALLRVDGVPAKNPSFWTKSVHFVHIYQKNGAFWFPASNRSVTDARIFGKSDMTIEYFDYAPNPSIVTRGGGHD